MDVNHLNVVQMREDEKDKDMAALGSRVDLLSEAHISTFSFFFCLVFEHSDYCSMFMLFKLPQVLTASDSVYVCVCL